MNPTLVTSFSNMTGTEPRQDFFFLCLLKKSFEAGGDPWESLCRIAMLKEITLVSEKETHFNFTPFIFEERKQWKKNWQHETMEVL